MFSYINLFALHDYILKTIHRLIKQMRASGPVVLELQAAVSPVGAGNGVWFL